MDDVIPLRVEHSQEDTGQPTKAARPLPEPVDRMREPNLLCSKCRAIALDFSAADEAIPYEHHTPYELELSANRGCHFCVLLLDQFTPKYPRWPDGSLQLDKQERWRELNLDKILLRPHFDQQKRPSIKATWKGGGALFECMDIDEHFAQFSFPAKSDISTGSKNSIALIKTWIRHCLQNHTGRNCPRESTTLPSRVLDIGITNADIDPSEQEIRLHVPEATERALYIALSHCWGDGQFITTTTSNLASHQVAIPWNNLPKTFQQAVNVTRQLGVRYLWIDSLCIIQDCAEDWETESSAMSNVFSNAFVTIFAAAAKDGSDGLFIARDVLTRRPCRLDLQFLGSRPIYVTPRYLRHSTLAASSHPLYSRAWVYQEQQLSPRGISFRADGISWSCRTTQANERRPMNRQSHTNTKPNGWQMIYNTHTKSMPSPKEVQELLHDLWYKVVEAYSVRKLAKATDRLPALSGLASRLHVSVPNDRYLVGIWKSDLLWGLLWIRDRITTVIDSLDHQTYTGPSWSWVSVPDGIGIRYPIRRRAAARERDRCYSEARLSSVEHVLKGHNTYGEVEGATLEFESWIAEIKIAEASTTGYYLDFSYISEKQPWNLIFDARSKSGEVNSVLVLSLFTVKAAFEDEVLGLMVSPTSHSMTHFRRIGVAICHAEKFKALAQLKKLILI